MDIIICDESYAGGILGILNEAILNSTALYDYRPRTMEMMGGWFEAKRKGNFPVLGAVGEKGELLGFASYGGFRNFPAYKYTVEHSVYVAAEVRGRGIGRVLLGRLVEEAVRQEYHMMVGVIDSQNAGSIALHKTMGFEFAGTLKQAGFKFGRWLDIDFYQRVLETPGRAVEG